MPGSRDAVLALVGAAILLVSGCGSTGMSAGAESEDVAVESTEDAAGAYGPEIAPSETRVLPGDIATVQVIPAPDVGDVVADGSDFTLYRYEKDTASPSKSSCNDPECTLVWVPLVAAGGKIEIKGGVDRALLGTMKRDDGLEQVTLAGWPLYRHVDDEVAGDVVGNGADGLWFAIRPDGQKAKG